MGRAIRLAVLLVSVAVAGYMLTGSVLGRATGESTYEPLAVYSQVLSRVQSDYVEEPNLHRVTVGALHGLLSQLDPFSAYLSPREFEEFQHREKQAGDVGLVLSRRMGWISVVTVLPGSPAARSDMRTGDLIESIAGISSREMSVEQAKLLLNGKPGTSVKLSLIRQQATEPETLTLVRSRLEAPAPLGQKLESDIGYVKIASFTPGTADRVRGLLKDFQRQGLSKLVLDLRDAATGRVEEAVTTAALLLDGGLITYSEGQQEPREQWTAEKAAQVWPGAVTVLINHGTAGPAEILAAAVLDNGRGEVVGQRSYGIGGIQKVIPLEDGSALILTVAKYYSPAGRAVAEQGVTPSVEASPPEGQALKPLPHAPPAPGDPVLLKALELLRASEGADAAA